MYHDSLEEVNRVKSDCEARVIAANDNYTVLKAENEVLKERVDILFKLGRSYLDRNNAANNTDKEKKEDSDEEIEVEVIDEENESCVIINFAESIHELVDNVVCMENFRYIKKIKRQSDQKDIKLVNNEIDLEYLT